jgi:3-hydroxyisobutyrate dehydrogenase-like beta-hydroxyacid dehydrogenase
MERKIAIIGFGEAGRAFAASHAPSLRITAYDLKTGIDDERAAMMHAFAEAGVAAADSAAAALADADAALSLVTADQALDAAREAAAHLPDGSLWLDMNSVAPETKRAAARAIEAGGGRYVDVAVMAPVHPGGRDTPLLVSGPHADAGAAMLVAIGFSRVRVVAGPLGAASAIKMIRSVLVKGIEALTAEAMLAAEAAGVRHEVLASLDASERPRPWSERADYNLDRMIVHGRRRAAEMEEVVATLDALGTGSAMARATVQRQRAIGTIGIAPPDGLDAKLTALIPQAKGTAE